MNDGDNGFTYKCSAATSRFQDGANIETRPVPKHVSTLDFLDLIPGNAYTVTIQSLSGELTNRNVVSGRTGKRRPVTVYNLA